MTLNLTPTQRKLWDLLIDHCWHDREELRRAIGQDRHDALETFHVHVCYFRKVLPENMLLVVRSIRGGSSLYRLVRV